MQSTIQVLIIGLVLYAFTGKTQNIHKSYSHFIFFTGISEEQLIKDDLVKTVTVRNSDGYLTQYSKMSTDSLVSILIAGGKDGQLKNRSRLSYDTTCQLLEYAVYSSSNAASYSQYVSCYREEMIGEEKHIYEYQYQVGKDGKRSRYDTIHTIEKIIAHGYPSMRTKQVRGKDGKLQDSNTYFIHQFDQKDRLIESKEFDHEQQMISHIKYHFLDAEKKIVIEFVFDPVFAPYSVHLFLNQDNQLVKSEIRRPSRTTTRIFEYNVQGRLKKLTQLNTEKEVEEEYVYEYELVK